MARKTPEASRLFGEELRLLNCLRKANVGQNYFSPKENQTLKHLAELGYCEKSGIRGSWHITDKGKQAVENVPNTLSSPGIEDQLEWLRGHCLRIGLVGTAEKWTCRAIVSGREIYTGEGTTHDEAVTAAVQFIRASKGLY